MSQVFDVWLASGNPTEDQWSCIKRFIQGRQVTDLGAGTYYLAKQLVNMGARKVIAVDVERRPVNNLSYVEVVQSRAEYYHEPIDVLFVSWPSNNQSMHGFISACERASNIIYLGKNTDGAACGTPAFFRYLLGRKVLAYLPDQRNTLIVYGGVINGMRESFGEELAGLDECNEILSYEEVEKR
jgi:hypothetical protein